MIRILGLLLLLPFAVRSQDFAFHFLRNEFEKYRFTKVKLRADHGALDYMLYDSLHLCMQKVNHRVTHPVPNFRYRTDPDFLKEKVFSVEQIINNHPGIGSHPVFMLKEVRSGDTLYFKYNPNSIAKFPFVVDGMVQEEDEFCHLLEKKELPFANVAYIRTPNRGTIQEVPVSLHKNIEDGKACYMLHLRTYGTRPHARVKGVSVYLSNGSRIYRNNAVIQFQETKHGYEYSASIKLSSDELEKLLNSTISKHQLYIYSLKLPQDIAHRFRMLTKCLTKME